MSLEPGRRRGELSMASRLGFCGQAGVLRRCWSDAARLLSGCGSIVWKDELTGDRETRAPASGESSVAPADLTLTKLSELAKVCEFGKTG